MQTTAAENETALKNQKQHKHSYKQQQEKNVQLF